MATNTPYLNKEIRNISSICIRNLCYDTTSEQLSQVKQLRKNSKFQLTDYTGDYSEFIKFNEKRLVTSFISLHYSTGELLYISEIVPSNMNPDYSTFSFSNGKRNKSDALIIKVWVKQHQNWKLLVQWNCQLSKLTYIDNQLDSLIENFKDNTILLRLGNRYYTDKTNMVNFQFKSIETIQHQLDSYSFDAIRSINNLDKSIQELKLSKAKLSKEITRELNTKNNHKDTNGNITNEIARLTLKVDELNKQITKEKSNNDMLLSGIMKVKIVNNTINNIAEDSQVNFKNNCRHEIEFIKNQVPVIEETVDSIHSSIKLHLKQFGEILSEVIPITNETSLDNLTIMGIEFPSSIKDLLEILYYNRLHLKNEYFEDVEDHNTKVLLINTALNYIIQLLSLLTNITNLSACYPIEFKGNYSIIKDFKNNEFPLYYDSSFTKKVNQYQNGSNITVLKNELFETGINLLNKNLLLIIHNLSDYYRHDLFQNIPIYCLDNFLWNLSYLILFLTADESKNNDDSEILLSQDNPT